MVTYLFEILELALNCKYNKSRSGSCTYNMTNSWFAQASYLNESEASSSRLKFQAKFSAKVDKWPRDGQLTSRE